MKKLIFTIAIFALGTGIALAQAPAKPAAEPSTMTKVETWTNKQWSDAKTTWAKDKTKWANCQHQSADQKLSGRKSWSFLYTCMNT